MGRCAGSGAQDMNVNDSRPVSRSARAGIVGNDPIRWFSNTTDASCQPIEPGGVDPLVPVRAEVIPPQGVGDDDEEVRLPGRFAHTALRRAEPARGRSKPDLTSRLAAITIAQKYTGVAKKYFHGRNDTSPGRRSVRHQAAAGDPNKRCRGTSPTENQASNRKERTMIMKDGASRTAPSRRRSGRAVFIAAVAILALAVGAGISGAATGKKSAVDPTLNWAIGTNPPSLFNGFYFGTEGAMMFSLTTHHILQPGVFGQPTTGPEAAVAIWKAVNADHVRLQGQAGDQVLRRDDDEGVRRRVLAQRPPRREDGLEDVLVLQQRQFGHAPRATPSRSGSRSRTRSGSTRRPRARRSSTRRPTT